MKKLRLRDDPGSDSIIMKRTKEVAGIELSEIIEKDSYPLQAKHDTEINKDHESLEGLTIVPGILDNKTA